jgi:hypothetical protein
LVLERPELAMRIGLIATAWSSLENYIITMFLNHSGISIENAFIIHDLITNLPVRLSVIRSVMKKRLPSSLYKNLVLLEQDIRKRAGERNAIVHGAWAISDDFPDDLMRQPLVGDIVRYTLKDFEDVFERITETALKVEKVWTDIGNTLRQPGSKSPSRC